MFDESDSIFRDLAGSVQRQNGGSGGARAVGEESSDSDTPQFPQLPGGIGQHFYGGVYFRLGRHSA